MTQVPQEVDMRDIKRKLQEDGLDPAATDEEKIKYIWQLYLQTESSLQTSLTSMEELRKQQMVEMAEVQNYMEHIRTLSNERETLTLEFEAENETLKEHVEKLTEELQGYRNHDEVKEMLMQQGLGDIAVGTTSEQIAYLLVERARLMDELEAEQAKGVVDTPEGMLTAPQLWEIVQQERAEFEDELKEQRDSLRTIKEQMRHTHEEEIANMMNENERLQELLDQVQSKHDRLQTQHNILTEKLEIREEEVLDLKQQIEEDATTSTAALSATQMEEVIKLQKRLQELTADNQTLKQTVKSVNTELQESTEKLTTQIEKQERTILALKCERDDLQREVDDLQASLRELQNQPVVSSTTPAENVQKEESGKQNGDAGENLQQSLQKAVEDLRNENRSLSHELSATKLELKKDRERLGEFERTNMEEDAQTMRNKIRGLEMKVSSLEGDLACSQRELWTKQNEYKKSFCQSPRPSLTSSASLDTTTTALRGLAKLRRSSSFADIEHSSNQSDNQLREVLSERDQLSRQLKDMTQLKQEVEDDLNEKKDQVEELEENIEQLQEDNKELAEQLQETLADLEDKQEQLDAMTHKNRAKPMPGVANQNAEASQQEAGQLRSEVGSVKSQLTKLNTDTSIADSSHQREVSILREQLHSLEEERNKLQNKLESAEQEITSLSQDVSRLENNEQKIEGQLNSEIGRCEDLENQNKKLEEDAKKAWDQFRELSIKSATLTTSNDHLKMELDRKTQMYNDLETNLSQQSVEKSSNLQSSHIRAESAERRLESLQKELEDVMARLTNTEHQLHEASKLKYDLQDREFKVSHLQGDVKLRDEEIGRLKTQLQQERQQRNATNMNSEELSSQVDRLKNRESELQRRNTELQRTLLDVQAKLEKMKDQTQNSKGQDGVDGPSFLSEAFSPQQQEIEDLRAQIVQLNEKYEVQLRKYTERKLRTKNKLHQARELYNQEKSKLKSELDSITNELSKVKMSLQRETEFKNQLEENYRKMMADKRNLLTQVAEHEEESREHARSLSMLQVRVRYLEEENSTLQLRIDSLTRQKHNLDRLLKDYQQDRHREAQKLLNESIEMEVHQLDEQPQQQQQQQHYDQQQQEEEQAAVADSDHLVSASDNSLLSSHLQHFTQLTSGIGSSLSLNLDGGLHSRSRSSDTHEYIGYDQFSSGLPKSGVNTTGPSSLVDCDFYS